MSEWISVKDRLPDIGSAVMVFICGSSVPAICSREYFEIYGRKTEDVYFELITENYRTSGYDFIITDINQEMITHWMPLPDAPK